MANDWFVPIRVRLITKDNGIIQSYVPAANPVMIHHYRAWYLLMSHRVYVQFPCICDFDLDYVIISSNYYQ